MWYGVQNMSKYDIDIKVQPLMENLFYVNICRSCLYFLGHLSEDRDRDHENI